MRSFFKKKKQGTLKERNSRSEEHHNYTENFKRRLQQQVQWSKRKNHWAWTENIWNFPVRGEERIKNNKDHKNYGTPSWGLTFAW